METDENEATQQDTSDASGFNRELGKTWIYPTNLPVRKYQKDIVSEALFKNTMVCLPTGLGKTFIAAVVMHNYYRWFPSSKVIFMATTKPLVKQQLDACYKIVAMPKDTTAELTGTVLKQNRQPIWNSKRVFFLTPQVLLNDLDNVPDLGKQIKCIVLDEAHRARGKHAYCEVIQKLLSTNKEFRVLALTATPASNVMDVITICRNLLIAHLEIRTDDSPDVVPYLHHKTMETIVLKLEGVLMDIINEHNIILDRFIRILVKHNAIQSSFASLHKGRLFYLSKEYQEQNAHKRSTDEYRLVNKVFGTCMIIFHAHDLLLRHGMRSFLKFYEENLEKPLLISCHNELKTLLLKISEHVGPPLTCDMLPDGTHLKLPENCKFGHPKFYKLQEIVAEHFTKHDSNSKIIIFCEYKESVSEIYAILLQVVEAKPKMFMGQSSITQKKQVDIIESFRNGRFNTLVSTCIGEEGIDVGFVDLVICFDISNKSSVRLIQRIGRTGRDRSGRVVILVSEGREEQVLKDCLHEKKHLCETLIHAKKVDNQLFKDNPRMLPQGVDPQCQELFITCQAPSETETKRNKLNFLPADSAPVVLSTFIPQTSFLCLETDSQILNGNEFSFRKQPHKQRSFQNQLIDTSQDCDIFVSLMKTIEYKRYNLPVTSHIATQKPKSKQADIRTMFKQTQSFILSQQTRKENDNGVDLLVDEKINAFLHQNNPKNCELCEKFEDNEEMCIKNELAPIDISFSNLNLLVINFSNVSRLLETFKPVVAFSDDDDDFFDGLDITQIEEQHLTNGAKEIANDCLNVQINPEIGEGHEHEKNDSNNSIDLFIDCDFQTQFQTQNECKTDAENIQNSQNTNIAINLKPVTKLNTPQSSKRKFAELDDCDEVIEGTPCNKQISSFKKSRKRRKLLLDEVVDVDSMLESFSKTKPEINSINLVPESPVINSQIPIEKTLSPCNNKTITFKKTRKQKKLLLDEVVDVDSMLECFSKTKPEINSINLVPESPVINSQILIEKTLSPNNKTITFKKARKQKKLLLDEVVDVNSMFQSPPKTTSEVNSIISVPENPLINSQTLSGSHTLSTDLTQKTSLLLSTSIETNINLVTTEWQAKMRMQTNSAQNCNEFKESLNAPRKELVELVSDDGSHSQSPILSNYTVSRPSTSNTSSNTFSSRGKRKRLSLVDICDFSFANLMDIDNSQTTKTTNQAGSSLNSETRRYDPEMPSTSSYYDRYENKELDSDATVIASSPESPIIRKRFRSNRNRCIMDTMIDFDSFKVQTNKMKRNEEIPVENEKENDNIREQMKTNKAKAAASGKSKKKKNKRSLRDFIDCEAALSDDDEFRSDDESSGSSDIFDESFVDDTPVINANETQMKAIYLQSVRSPLKRVKPLNKPTTIASIAMDSFIEDPLDQTYVRDSFCVESDSFELTQTQRLSELDIAEMKLAQELKSRKLNKQKNKDSNRDMNKNSNNAGKWKRISLDDSESD